MNRLLLIFGVAIVALNACKKDSGSTTNPGGASAADIAKADSFKVFITGKQFQIRDYYADHPIDYIDTDAVVKAETDLWSYVSPWIKDDANLVDIAAGKVTITQNAIKIPGDNSPTLVKDFTVGADASGAYVNFLNYQYNPLKYHLVEFTSDHFTVYADWTGGAKVYTKFGLLQ